MPFLLYIEYCWCNFFSVWICIFDRQSRLMMMQFIVDRLQCCWKKTMLQATYFAAWSATCRQALKLPLNLHMLLNSNWHQRALLHLFCQHNWILDIIHLNQVCVFVFLVYQHSTAMHSVTLLYKIYLSISRRYHVACSKDYHTGLWRMVKFNPSPHQHLSTDHHDHQILYTYCVVDTQNFILIPSGVSSPYVRCTPAGLCCF